MKASEPREESLQLLVSGAELKVETGAGEAGPSAKGGPPAHQASRTHVPWKVGGSLVSRMRHPRHREVKPLA